MRETTKNNNIMLMYVNKCVCAIACIAIFITIIVKKTLVTAHHKKTQRKQQKCNKRTKNNFYEGECVYNNMTRI